MTSTNNEDPNRLPRLAVFHDRTSESIFAIHGTARGLCRIVWVVGWSTEAPQVRMLARFGDVIDVTGMDEATACEQIVAQDLDGVVVFNDPPMRLAAAVADRLGFPFHSPHTAVLLTDKFAQRTALREAGLPTPEFAAVRATNFSATGVPLPAVLKPRAGAGSRDTFKIENSTELSEAMAMCDPDEEFILEEWLPDRTTANALGADVLSVESIARDGLIGHIVTTGRFPFAEPFRETGSFMPSDVSSEDKRAILALAGEAAHALQIRHGVLHTEIKLTPHGPRLLEVNGRLGGGIHDLLSRLGGPPLREWAVKLALGRDVGLIPDILESPVVFFRWITAPRSAIKVVSVEGLHELNELQGVDEVSLNRQPGDGVDSREGSPLGHVVRIDGRVETHSELSELIQRKIPSTLRVAYDSV
jgi:ATP-grasp domain